MSNRLLLSSHAGFQEIVHIDPSRPDDLIIEERQDCTHIVEAAKILADEPPSKDFRLAAFIPEHVMNRAFREGWLHDKAAWKRWANDPDNARFRVWKGRM